MLRYDEISGEIPKGQIHHRQWPGWHFHSGQITVRSCCHRWAWAFRQREVARRDGIVRGTAMVEKRVSHFEFFCSSFLTIEEFVGGGLVAAILILAGQTKHSATALQERGNQLQLT